MHVNKLILWTCLLLLILLPTAIVAQGPAAPKTALSTTARLNTREFLNLSGSGEYASTARVTFYRSEDEELCVLLGVKRGPKALNKGYFKFTRFTTVAGETDETRFKFPFPKQGSTEDKTLRIYDACLEDGAKVDGADKDLILVTVRRPGHLPTKMYINYPPADAEYGFNISTTTDSKLVYDNFVNTRQ